MAKSQRTNNTQEPKKSPSKLESIRKVTHLYLNDKNLTAINNLNGYVHLTVLYLHSNNIDQIQNLDNLAGLRSLYLQRNKIRKIEHLDGLIKLQRLYLGHNEINVVENLENLKYLEELHIEKQNLASGDKLCFDPRSIQCLSNSLEVLNVSSNNISTLQMLTPLKYLRILNASTNNISQLQNITETVSQLGHLREAIFSGNPVSKEHRYRESIIAKSSTLKTLDQKEVTDITRCFMKRFEAEKSNFESRDITNLPKNIDSVAKSYPLPLQKAVSTFMLKPTKSTNDTCLPSSTSGAYIPWKRMPSTFGNTVKMPLLLKKQKKMNEHRKMNLASLPSLL